MEHGIDSLAQAKVVAGLLRDPEKAKLLSFAQQKELTGLLRGFTASREEEKAKLEDKGLTTGQAQRLQVEQDKPFSARTDGTDAPIHPRARAAAVLGGSLMEGGIQAIEGVIDLGQEVAVWLGLQDRAEADEFKQFVAKRRFNEKMDSIKTYGKVNPAAIELTGQIAPWLLTGPAQGANLTRVAFSNIMTGTLAGGAIFSGKDLQERGNSMLLGGSLGLGFSAFAVPGAIRGRAASLFIKQLNGDGAQVNLKLEQSIRAMFKAEDFGFSMTQLTGNKFFSRLEAGSAAKIQKAQQNANINILMKTILKQAREFSAVGRSADDIAGSLRGVLGDANKAIHKRAGDQFKAGLQKLESDFGDDIIMDFAGGQSYLDDLDRLIAEGSDNLRFGNVSKEIRKYRKGIDQLVNPVQAVRRKTKLLDKDGKQVIVWDLRNRRTGEVSKTGVSRAEAEAEALLRNESLGGFEAGELRRITTGLNDLLSGKVAVLDSPDPNTNKAVSKALMGSLMKNLKSNNKNPLAVEALEGLRSGYKNEMQLIREMEGLVINRVFGQAILPGSTDELLDIVLKGGRSSLNNTRKFLETWDRALLDDLRATALRRAVRNSRDPSGAQVDTSVFLDSLAKNIAGDVNGVGQLAKGLFPPQVQGQLVRVGQALKTIKNLYFRGVREKGSFSIDDLAINVISQSPEFMGRFLTRLFTGGKSIEAAMTDPLVREAIITIANAGAKGPVSTAGTAAMHVLNQFLVSEDIRADETRIAEQAAAGQAQSRPSGIDR